LRVPIDEFVWHLDVDSSHPGGAQSAKGSAVRRLKWYVSWVQNVVRQFGPYLLYNKKNNQSFTLVREDREELTSGKSITVSSGMLKS